MRSRAALLLRASIGALVVAGSVQACAIWSPARAGAPCATTFTADRCQALALAAADRLVVGFDAIAAVDVLPNPSPEPMDRANPTFLSVVLLDGSRHDVTINCGGIRGAYFPACMADPAVPLGFSGAAASEFGYADMPVGASPFPALDPGAVAAARSLQIDSLVVPVTAVGPQVIVVGRASLPNGYLAEAQFALADPWPSDVLFTWGISIEVRPVAGGPPLRNQYEHGWHEGVEEVEATLVFDVAWFLPGASIPIIDLVVR
jgi:hypothetical protein